MIHSASSTRRVGLDRLRINRRNRRHDTGASVTRMRSASTLIQWTVSTAQAHSPLTPPVVPPPSPVSRGVPIVVPMPPVVPAPGPGPRPDEVSRGLPTLEPLVGSEIAPVPYDDEESRDPNPRETPNIVPVEPGVVPTEPAAIHTITLAATTLLPRLMTASLSIQEIERVDADVIGRRAGVELHGEVGAAQGIDGVIQRLEHGPKYLARRIQLIDAEDDVVSRLAAVVVDVARDAHVAVPVSCRRSTGCGRTRRRARCRLRDPPPMPLGCPPMLPAQAGWLPAMRQQRLKDQ